MISSSSMHLLRWHHALFICTIIISIHLWQPVAGISKVHFITTFNNTDEPFPCSSLRSGLSRSINVTILGLSYDEKVVDRGDVNQNHSIIFKQPYIIMEHFKKENYKDDDIIIFNNNNVLYAANSDVIEAAFLKIEKNNSIIFAAQRECLPDSRGCREPSSDMQSSYKYLYAGGWIARYRVARSFMQLYIQAFASIPISLEPTEQRALHQYTLGKAGKIGIILDIDHYCNIFQTSSASTLSGQFWWALPSLPKARDGPYMLTDGTINNTETSTYPLLYHFDNENEKNIQDIESLMWSRTKSSNSNYKIQCENYLKKYPSLNACHERGLLKNNVPFYCDGKKIDLIKNDKELKMMKEILLRQQKSDNNSNNNNNLNKSNHHFPFPSHVPIYQIRKDTITKKSVIRGRLKLLEKSVKYPMEEYKKILQCSKDQPELYGKGGALSLTQKIPLTRETVMMISVYLETWCQLWAECRLGVMYYVDGYYLPRDDHNKLGGFYEAKLFRITNGTFYYDWPWGRYRINMKSKDGNNRLIIKHVVDHVSDIKDCVFFYGGEFSLLPPGIPVPSFSSAPLGSSSSDIPGLWNAAYLYEVRRYEQKKYLSVWEEKEIKLDYEDKEDFFDRNKRSNDTLNHTYSSTKRNNPNLNRNRTLKSWRSRVNKGAFFGSMTDSFVNRHDHLMARQVVMNMAIDHPDVLVANFTSCNSIAGKIELN